MIEINGVQYKTYNFNDISQDINHGFIYITVNKINLRKYVGQHSAWKPHYLGSGKYLRRAIRKYGEENFERIIIDIASSQKELDDKETHYINFAFGVNTAKSVDWYNVKDGAQNGGNKYAGLTPEEYREQCEKISKANSGENNHMYGKKHSEETRRKMRVSASKRTGKRNVMYGKRGSEHSKSKTIMVFKDGDILGEFGSITDFAISMGSKFNSDPIMKASQALSKGWIPKRGRFKGYTAQYKEKIN